MKLPTTTCAVLAMVAMIWVPQTAHAQTYVAGDFTFEFVNPATGLAITQLNIPTVGGTTSVAVYLLQTGHTSNPLLANYGAEGLGARINYANSGSSTGTAIVAVPNLTQLNMAVRPAGTVATNQGYPSDFDFISRWGTGTTTNLANSAAIAEGLLTQAVLPFPSNGGAGEFESPSPSLAMLVGTFMLKGLASGTQTVQAVTIAPGSTFNLSGPIPKIMGSYPDGTTGPTYGNSVTNGEINIDSLLSTTIPTLMVTVGAAGVPTWTGNTSGSWNNSGNWISGIPASGLNTQLAFGATSNATTTNDIPGTLTLNQLTFYGGSPAFALTGNGLNFVTNGSGSAPQVLTNSSNGVTIGAALTLTNSLTVSGTGDLMLTGAISGPGGLAKAGPGTLTLGNASNNFSGGVTFSGGAVAVGNLGALGAGALTFDGGTFLYSGLSATMAAPINITSNSGTLTVGTLATSLTATAGITGPGGLTKNGPGILVLAGTNNYAGPTNVTAGMLAVATGAALGAGNVTVGASGALAGNGTINGHTEIAGTISPGIANVGTLNFAAPLVWDAGGTYSFGYSAVTGLNPGVNYSTIASSSTLNLSAITAPFTIAVTSLNGQTSAVPVTFTLGSFSNGGSSGGISGFNAANFAFTGALFGNPSVSMDATHNQLLLTITPGAVTWTGSASGIWSNPGNWSAGVPLSNVNTQLVFGATVVPTMTNDIPGTLTLNQLTVNAGAPAYTLGGNGLNFATNSSSSLPQIVTNSANGFTIGSPITLANNLTVSGTGNVTLNGVIAGGGGLTKAGGGMLTLTNSSSSFSGGVTISGGTLAASSLAALGTGSWTFDGGALSYGGATTATATPVNITANGGTIAVGAATTLTINGTVGGPGGLTKTGTGTLVLAGTVSYGGATNITTGSLVVSTGVSVGPGSVTVGPVGALTGIGTISGNTEIAGTIAPGTATSGTLNFGAPMVWDGGGIYAFAYSATTNLNPGVNYATIKSLSTLDLSRITSANPFTIVIPSIAQSNGTPVTYTLGTFNNGGPNGGITGFNSANFAFTGAFNGTPAVSVDATQNQLLLTFTPVFQASLTWNGTANGNWNNSGNWSPAIPASNVNTQLTFGATSNATMTNDIPGTLILNQLTFNAGAPAYTLAGNGLDLRTNGVGALPQIVNNSNNGVTIGAAMTLTNNLTVSGTGNVTFNGAIGGPGGLTKSGPGTLVLAGSVSYGGATSVTAGTLMVSAGVTVGPGAVTVGPSSVLAGTGTINGHTEIGGAIAPGGASIGALNFAAPMVWDAGGTYAFGYSATTNLNPGVNYTTITSSSTLDLSSITHANPFTIVISSLSAQSAGNPVTFTLGTFNNGGSNGGITGLNSANFAFTGAFTGTPAVSLDATQNQLLLTFTPLALTTFTWTGSANGSWSNFANWSAGVPASNVNMQVTFGATPNATMTNDIPGTLILNQLTFNAGAPAYTLNGNGLDLRTSNGGNLPQIVNNSANAVTIGAAMTLTNNLTVNATGNVTLNGTIGGPGGLTKTGPGTLILTNVGNNFTGGVTVTQGTLGVAADDILGTTLVPVNVGPAGTLQYTASASTSRTIFNNGGTVQAATGATLTFQNATVAGGFLVGSFATMAGASTAFIGNTTTASTNLAINGSDSLTNFSQGGPLTVAAGQTVTMTRLTNQGSGTITMAASSKVNVTDFQSYGLLNIANGASGGTSKTLLTNTGTTPLYFNGGSRTFIGTIGGNVTTSGIELNGQNAIIAGGLFVNNGQVTDNSAAGISTVIADYGALIKGAGEYDNSPQTRNGGKFQAGNSPGVATVGRFVFGPGGVSNYVFAIDDATGQAGPTPDAAGHVSGWGLVKSAQWQRAAGTTSGDFVWTANAANPLTIAIDTLVNPTTAGTDVSGLMADFDPSRSYSWPAVQWSGTYSGPTDVALLDAATNFDTSGLANPINGTFGWSLSNSSLSLSYVPSAVPEPGSLILVGAAFAFGWRRLRIGRRVGTAA